jgi:hypothetical protein
VTRPVKLAEDQTPLTVLIVKTTTISIMVPAYLAMMLAITVMDLLMVNVLIVLNLMCSKMVYVYLLAIQIMVISMIKIITVFHATNHARPVSMKQKNLVKAVMEITF